jgi:hypothetical protein
MDLGGHRREKMRESSIAGDEPVHDVLPAFVSTVEFGGRIALS